MTINYLTLFCLFRRILGLFFIIFVYGKGSGQITLSGDVLMINNEIQDSNSAHLYISKGTYTYNSTQNNYQKEKQRRKRINKVFADHKVNIHTKASRYRKIPKSDLYLFSLLNNYQKLFLFSAHKISFAGSGNDYHKKYAVFIVKEHVSMDAYRFLSTKRITKTFRSKHKYSGEHHRIRPPPYFTAI